ncbi:hypothetical protein D3C85_1083020 [compost metagenome]
MSTFDAKARDCNRPLAEVPQLHLNLGSRANPVLLGAGGAAGRPSAVQAIRATALSSWGRAACIWIGGSVAASIGMASRRIIRLSGALASLFLGVPLFLNRRSCVQVVEECATTRKRRACGDHDAKPNKGSNHDNLRSYSPPTMRGGSRS